MFGDGLLRIRHVLREEDSQSLNERVGLVTPGKPRLRDSKGPTLKGDASGLRWELNSPGGNFIGSIHIDSKSPGRLCTLATSHTQDGWYGLGFHRKKMELHGLTMRWERAHRHSEATVPFFFTTAGYGVFSNTTWPRTFDFTNPNQWLLRAEKGNCDIFLIYGPSPKQILDGYTNLCGRPEMPPRWALGSSIYLPLLYSTFRSGINR